MRSDLPSVTHKFLRSEAGAAADIVVHRFHAWMSRRRVMLPTLTPRQVRSFLRSKLRKAEAEVTGYDFNGHLAVYLAWLYAKNKIAFDPDGLKAPCNRRLPETVERYLAEIAIAARPKSWASVRTDLRAFHHWLHKRKLTLRGFAREHAVEWLIHLVERRLHPSTRRSTLVNVRAYLRWLAEQRLIWHDPEELLRPSDQPKLPHYLPRPFPPEVDKTLQARFAVACNLQSQGLLLMRRTGLRIGELLSLPCECTTTDDAGRSFLKVPLGKLLTERLVPLDAATAQLVQELARREPTNRRWLLEDRPGMKPTATKYMAALRHAAKDQPLTEPATTHRLRHTYATELLNAGMSLVGVMKLLGHSDHRMTLRYAAILPETVASEYLTAHARIKERYQKDSFQIAEIAAAPDLNDILAWLKNRRGIPEHTNARRLALLIRRVDALAVDLHDFISTQVNP